MKWLLCAIFLTGCTIYIRPWPPAKPVTVQRKHTKTTKIADADVPPDPRMEDVVETIKKEKVTR